MNCSSNCRTKDHATYGECLRAKGIQIDKFALSLGREADKQKDHTLARFRDCVKSGLTPASPLKSDVEKAERQLSLA